jgi:hypothetical protein
MLGVSLGNSLHALLPVHDLMHAALLAEILNRSPHLATGELLDRLF